MMWRAFVAFILINVSNIIFASELGAEITEFKLSNGLKVIVKEDHRSPIVVSMVWYNVGSADEPGGHTGLSHALEHMMFKGTARFPLGVFSKTISAQGGEENAFTNSDYTAYYEILAANKLATSFELEADRMSNLNLNEEEFAKEIKVIQEERRLRTDDNPQSLTFERFLATAHLSDPYHHPVIGWMSDLQQMKVEELKHWYQQYYAPNNANLVVVGDVNAADVRRLAEKYFAKIDKKSQYVRKSQLEPPSFGKKFAKIVVPAKIPLLFLGYTAPTHVTATTPWEPYALEIIAGILDGGESARLSENLVRGQRLASSIAVYYDATARYQTQLTLYGSSTKEHNLKDLRKAIIKEINKLQHQLVSDEELKRVKNQIIAQKTFEKDSMFGQATELGMLETVGLGWQFAHTYSDHIKAITPEQIRTVAQKYLIPSAQTETQLLPATFFKEKK